MKDLKVLTGDGLKPVLPGDTGVPQLLVVRNKEQNGRRIGVFTKYGNAAAGQRLNQADALHDPKAVVLVPQGYQAGVEVNLSAQRNYYHFGTYYVGEKFDQKIPGMDWFATDVSVVDGKIVFGSTTKDLTKLRTTLKSGDASVSEATTDLSKNSFCTFTLIFAGTTYHLGLDIAKHPAHITADLNIRLGRIHPQLRGFVAIAEGYTAGIKPLEFYISPPEGLDVTIPLTTFNTEVDLSPTFGELSSAAGTGTFHLNKGLTSALLIDNTSGIRNTTNTVTTANSSTIKTVSEMIAGAYPVDLNLFTHEVATPTLYKGRLTIPASAFSTWDKDERLNFALLKLQRQYEDGRVFRLLGVRYKNADGSDTAYEDPFADLLVMRAPSQGIGAASLYLDDLASAEANDLVGYQYPEATAMRFPESGVLNEESSMYIALLATPTIDNRNSIFFRESVTATYLEIEYELVEADVIPQVKIDDLGTLDFHYIRTEEHAFRPVAFTTTPVHDWNIEFITDGQTERYQGLNTGPVGGSTNIQIATQGTVGEAVILAGIDYGQVKPPAEGEPLYHYTGEIGAQTWLYQNLPYVNVVTTRAVTALKSQYKVIFPDVAMAGTLQPLTEPLVAKQADGSLLISGRFSNPAYLKNVFFHSTNTTWDFNLKGQTLTPTEPMTFNALTGEFGARFAVNDLVEPGPGTHVFRVTAQANYPWLSDVTQYTQTMDIVVLPAVEGIEDDVTFIGTSIFDKTVDGTETSGYRLVDLDSGEVLATGENIFALQDDATTRGLIDIDLIYGQPAPLPISCEGALSSVDLEITGEWVLEIEGEIVGSGTMETLLAPAALNGVEIILPPPPPPPVPMSFRIAAPSGIATLDFNAISTEPGTEVVVDWGDGSPVETWTPSVQFKPYHEYPRYTSCIATVTINQPLAKMYLSGSAVTEIIDFGNVAVTDRKFNFSQLTKVPAALPSYVTKMNYMFGNCLKLNDPAISNWDVSNVTEMDGTFEGCKLFNQPLNWHVGNVVLMRYFLSDCLAFNQDLSGWCVPNILAKPNGFDSGATKYALPRPVWGTCPNGI